MFAEGKPYTSELNRLGAKIDAWRMIVKKKLSKNMSSRAIKRAALDNAVLHTRDLTLKECIESPLELIFLQIKITLKRYLLKNMMQNIA